MLGSAVRNLGDRVASSVVSMLARAGMRPAGCHACELAAAVATAVALCAHVRPLALVFFVLHGFFDYLDGALRRRSPWSAIDSPGHAETTHALADKLCEVAIFSGIAIGGYAAWWVVSAAMGASVAATCTGFAVRRLAGVPRERCVFDRSDRMFVLLIFLAVMPSSVLLVVVCAMDCVTIIQRVVSAVVGRTSVPQPKVEGS